MLINGEWLPNITCPRCRFRHPAQLHCREAEAHAQANKVPPDDETRCDSVELRIGGDYFTLDGDNVLVNGSRADHLKGKGNMARLCLIREALRTAETSLL